MLYLERRRVVVSQIQDHWKVNLWWLPTPVDRMYLKVRGDGGQTITVFRDQGTGLWYQQNY